MKTAQARDALASALGRVVADVRREISIETRAVIAELTLRVMTLETALKASAEQSRQLVLEAIAKVKDGAPGLPGVDGRDGDRGEKGDPGERGEAGPAGERGEPGERGLTGVPGCDGAAGRDGRDGMPGLNGKDGAPGADGQPGLNGKDGAGFESWHVDYDKERTFTFSCGPADNRQQFSFAVPFPLDQGVHKSDRQYVKGDEVTFAGSQFIAQIDTTAKPETNSDWRLAVKRGRDGKEGKPGEKGERGADGKPGRDLTQLGPDGAKWG